MDTPVEIENGEIWEEACADIEVKRKLLLLAAFGQSMQWVSVADRLPGKNEVILTYDRDGIGLQVFCNGFCEEVGNKITHWMPLPPNPGGG